MLVSEIVKNCLRYLLNNQYFKLGNAVFRLMIAIPMGSDPAPFMANLIIHYENRCVRKGIKNRLDELPMFPDLFMTLQL